MQQHYHFRFLLVALLVTFSLPLLFAGTITVTSTADAGPGSLRAAVKMAHPGDEIVFSTAINGDPIVLLSVIDVRTDLKIRGNGQAATMISGNGTNRAFSIMNGAEVHLYDLMIYNGREFLGGGLRVRAGASLHAHGIKVDGCVAFSPRPDRGGGAVYNEGMLYMERCTLANNTAVGKQGSGGAIFNAKGASLEVAYTIIRRNEANRAGGGIEDASGRGSAVTIVESHINENVVYNAPGNGGGVHIGSDGDVTLTGGTVDQNVAGAEGGGIWNGAGTLTVRNTLVRNNEARGDDPDQGGGGLYNNGNGTIILMDDVRVLENRATGMAGSGGGILNNVGASLLITDSEVSANEANRAGGGIEDASGSGSAFTITNSMIDRNVVYTSPGNGGGIHIGGDGSLTVTGGTVNDNEAGAEGGGIWNNLGTLTLNGNAVVRRNVARGNDPDQGGGGLYNNGGGTIVLRENVQILDNRATGTAGSGGGILNNTGATLMVSASYFSGNEANRAGGGIEDASGSGSMVTIMNTDFDRNRVNFAPGNGGAVHVGGDGDLAITGGMVTNNSAGQEGGGLWNSVGTMDVTGVTFEYNTAEGDKADDGGGALFNNGGTLNVTDSRLTKNMATGSSGSGGGLFSTGGTVTVTGGEFDFNTSNRAGGAVEIVDGSYSSTDVRYDRNKTGSAPGNGGAFHVTGTMSTVDFTGGWVTGNTAANEGGGIWNQAGTMMTISGVSILHNTVTNVGTLVTRVAGAGVFNNGGILDIENSTIAYNELTGGLLTAGGGVANNTGGTVTIMASTISNNKAGGAGGGVANDGSVELTNVTITENYAKGGGGYAQGTPYATLYVTGSIIADNDAYRAPDVASLKSMVTSGGYNLIGMDDDDQFPAIGTDKEGMSAKLGKLSDNGGTMLTHNPLCGSPAIDMGNPDDVSPDQLGQMVFGGTRDIGALERQSACPGTDYVMMSANPLESSASRLEATDAVSVFPNPAARDYLNVRLPRQFAGDVTLSVIGADGRTHTVKTTQAPQYRLDLTGFAVGTYTLQVTSGKETQTTRFVIAR